MENQSKRQITKISASTLAGRLGSGILTFIIGLLILQTTDSALHFGFSQLIGPVVSFILLPVKGSIVDTFDKKKILIYAQMLTIAALGCYAVAVAIQGIENLLYTYLLLIVLKISDQFLFITFTASFSTIVIDKHIQKIKSIQQVIQAFSMLCIPVFAVFLHNMLPLVYLVILEIIIEIIAVLIILTIQFDLISKEEKVNEVKGLIPLFLEGIVFVKKYKKLVFALFFAMFANFIFGAINVGLPFIQVSILQFSDMTYGLTEAVFAIGMILSGIILSSTKNIKFPLLSSLKMILFIGFLLAVLGVLLSFDLPQWILILIIGLFNFFLGIAFTRANIPISTWMITAIPSSYHGRVFNLLNAGAELLNPLGILSFSFLFDSIPSWIVFFSAGCAVIVLAVFYPLVFNIDLRNSKLDGS